LSLKGAALLIDRTHRAWMVATLVILAASTAAYVVYAQASPDGPRGGTVPGLLFGIAGSLLMVFAGLLSGRKQFPALPLGSAQFWLRGHIWLGLLSGPMILFHAGFQWGGLLEQILLLLTVVIIASGVIGLVVQQQLPRTMAATIPAEAMFDQLASVCQSLCASGDQAVTAACGPAVILAPSGDEPAAVLAGFYRQTVRPFLGLEAASPLVQATAAAALFGQVRQRVPEAMQPCLNRLAELCDERRQLLAQARLHRWLHGWLLLHVPLSAALLVLGLVHAFYSVWY
jgi:hypothetical protein